MIAEYLYREIELIGMIIFLILLHNNIELYRLRLKDPMSVMLLGGLIMSISELGWDICSGHPDLRIPAYISTYLFICSIMVITSSFNKYFMSALGASPKSRRWDTVAYKLPVVAMAILCITSPWTRLVAWVDKNGVIRYGGLFDTLYSLLVALYLFSVLFLTLAVLIRNHRNDSPERITAGRLLIAYMIGVGSFLIQDAILNSAEEEFISISLSFSVCLIYLTTTVNTSNLLKKQAEIEAVESEMRVATSIQLDAIPSGEFIFPPEGKCELKAYMSTARDVGGDFYDYFPLDNHRICFVIADVSGKGMPAALFMMTAKTMVSEYAQVFQEPKDIFTKVNARLSRNNKSCMFATAWVGILDTDSGIMKYTNAGHNYPLFYRQDEGVSLLNKKHGLFLAAMDDTIYRQDEMQMQSGDRLLLYTDGITDAHDPNGNLYGTQRLMERFEKLTADKDEKVLEHIAESAKSFADTAPQFDDMTMMIITIR